MTFFVAVSTLALLHATRSPSRGWWALYVLAATAAAYSHYTACSCSACRRCGRCGAVESGSGRAIVSNVRSAMLYLPWLPQLRGKALAVIGSLYPLGVSRVLEGPPAPDPGPSGRAAARDPDDRRPDRLCPHRGGGTGRAGPALARHPGSARGAAGRLPPAVLIVALMFATPVGLLLYSLLATDLWLPRGLSASIPAAALVLGALVAALPRPLAVAAGLVIAVTLLAGTARSLGPAYDRGPYRTLANYLDRVARPSDPVVLATYAGAGPLLVQFKRAHTVVRKPALWSQIGPAGTGYLVLDEQIARILHVSTVPPRGFVLIASRHYGGGLPTDLLSYRRVSAGG